MRQAGITCESHIAGDLRYAKAKRVGQSSHSRLGRNERMSVSLWLRWKGRSVHDAKADRVARGRFGMEHNLEGRAV